MIIINWLVGVNDFVPQFCINMSFGLSLPVVLCSLAIFVYLADPLSFYCSLHTCKFFHGAMWMCLWYSSSAVMIVPLHKVYCFLMVSWYMVSETFSYLSMWCCWVVVLVICLCMKSNCFVIATYIVRGIFHDFPCGVILLLS